MVNLVFGPSKLPIWISSVIPLSSWVLMIVLYKADSSFTIGYPHKFMQQSLINT